VNTKNQVIGFVLFAIACELASFNAAIQYDSLMQERFELISKLEAISGIRYSRPSESLQAQWLRYASWVFGTWPLIIAALLCFDVGLKRVASGEWPK
jgi:hypothetical protein